MDNEILKEEFCFYRLCTSDFETAARVIKTLRRHKNSEVREWLIQIGAITYAKPFSSNWGKTKKKHSLEKKLFVPAKFIQLHDKIMDCRDKWWAHTDIDAKNPVLSQRVWDLPGMGVVRPMQVKTDPGIPFLIERLDDMALLIAEVRSNVVKKLHELEPQVYPQIS